MRYCLVHARGWIPAGFDLRKRQSVPGRWHPLTVATVRLALQVATMGACRGQISVEVTACDRCEAVDASPPHEVQ
jgi:hypothetical protein